MEEFKENSVLFSKQYIIETDGIYPCGLETFWEIQTDKFEYFKDSIPSKLSQSYWM